MTTKNQIIIWGLGILLFSLVLEIQRLNLGNQIIDTTDVFRTLRDIAWTGIMIVGFSKNFNIQATKKQYPPRFKQKQK